MHFLHPTWWVPLAAIIAILAGPGLSAQAPNEVVLRPTNDLYASPSMVSMGGAEPRFSKEPEIDRSDLEYGLLQIQQTPGSPAFGYIRDRKNNILYIDRNGNFDLTDDGENAIPAENADDWLTTFPKIPVLQEDSNTGPRHYFFSLYFYRNSTPSINLRSGWQGIIQVGDLSIDLAILDNLDGKLGAGDWMTFGNRTGTTRGPHPLRNDLFINGKAVHIDYRFEALDGQAVIKAVWEPTQSQTGTLLFNGPHVAKATLLSSTTLAFLDNPGAQAELPIGVYRVSSLLLQSGIQAQHPDAWPSLAVEPGKEFKAPFGAEPKPSVTIKKTWGGLLLSYNLQADGEEYQADSSSQHPPYFKVFKNEKLIAQHDFEYG